MLKAEKAFEVNTRDLPSGNSPPVSDNAHNLLIGQSNVVDNIRSIVLKLH